MTKQDIDFDSYLKLPALNASLLKCMLTSPRMFRHRQQEPLQDNDALRQGRACHTAVLEPDRFLLDYAVWRKSNGRRYGKKWDEFCDVNSDKTVLTEEQYTLACKLRDVVRNHPVAGRYLSEPGAQTEVTFTWEHSRTGLTLKSRVDWLGSALIDIKTCRDPAPHAFAAASVRYGYPLQMAMYNSALIAAGEQRPIKIIAMQKVEPFDVVVYDLPDETLMIGEEQLERALDQYIDCMAANKWPGIADDEELPLNLPVWARPGEDEIELTIGGEAIGF
jgi:hypothetical protein